MKPEPNPYLPRVNSQRLLNLLDVGHNAPAPVIVTKPVRMGGAGDFQFPDVDRDGVPDLFDCEPFNPEADGWWGDAYKAAKSFFTPNYAVAASRRASVRQAVSGGARAAASYVRYAPTRPTQTITRHIARHITRAAAPTIKRIVSRPSPEQLKRVTAAAFPKTTAMITAAGELKKVVGAMRPPSGAELVQAGVSAIPGGVAAVAMAKGAVAARPVVEQALKHVDYDYAAQQRKKVMGAGWGAPGQVLAGIAEMGEPFRARMESQVAATTARQQAKFPEGTISPKTRGFSEQTQQVAGYVREVEQPTEQWMLGAEERLGLHSEQIPESLRWIGGQAKRAGYGAAFTMPSGMVEMVGMVPVAVEAAWKRKDIIPSAIAVGYHTMGKSMYHSAINDPARMAGEFLGFKGLGKVLPIGKTKAKLAPTKTKAKPAPTETKATLTSTPVSQSALVSELAHGYAAHLKYRLISHAIGERGGAVSRKMATLVTKRTAEPHKGVMQDLLALPKEEALKFSTGFEATRRLMHAESPISRPLDFTKITAFPGKSGKVVESWILKHPEQRSVVYGGAASRVHMKGSRTIGDIDMGVMDVKQAAREIATDLRAEIGAKNVRTSYDPKWKASKVWVRSDGNWEIAVDLNPVSKMYSTLEFGLLSQPHVKVGGITYTTLGEQLARKAAAVYMPRGGKVRPKPQRAAKDIADIDALYGALADQPMRSWYQRSSLPPIPYLRATFQPPKIPKIPRTQVISSASVGALGVPSSATTQALPAMGIGSIFGTGATLAGLGTMAHTFNLQKPETAWEAVSLATKQHTKPFGLYGAPIEHREYQEAIKDYEAAHAASMDLSKAYDEKFGGMGTATDAQVAAANRMIHEIEAQNRKAEEAYAEVLRAEEKYREERAGMSIPSLQEISDAGAPFREKHKKEIDVIRGGYEKYSPKYAKDVIYPAIGYGLSYGIPTLQKISDAGAPFREEHKKEIDQIRGLVQTVGKLPAMPMLAPFEMAVGRKPTTLKDIHPYVAGYTIGEYEEFQKHPLRWAVTTVGLAALTPALKGVGWAGKAVGVTGLVGKVPVVGVPIVKYATPALFAGMGAMWLTSIAGEYEKAKTPFEKGKLTGRLMISDVIPFALAPGLSKPMGRVLKYPVTKVGEATGLIRQKTIVHKIPSPDVGGASLPAQSAAQQVEMLLGGKWVKGATGVPYTGKAPHTAFTTVQVGALEEVGLELVAKGAGHHLVPMPKAGTLQLSTVFLRGAKAVEVPPALKRKIYKSIQETGGFEREYPEIVRLAHAQSRKLGQPVAIPSEFRMIPGGTFGGGAWAESEMVLIFGSKKAKEVASSRFVGFTERGDVIKQITYGTQPKIPKLKKLSFIPENIGYNVQKQKKYLEAMTEHAQRKHEELYGDALSYPGAYGGHGRGHAEDVLLKMESIWSKSPALQKKYRKEVLEAAAKLHDIYKVRDAESEPLRHALAAERGISKGLLRDIPELAVLTKSELKIVAHAVGLHTKVDPGIVSRTWHQPSDLAKMLATADRLALERYGITVNPRKLFSFGEPTTQAKGLVSLKTAEVAALVGGVIVGGSAPPIRGKGGFMTIIEPVKTTKTPSKPPKYSQVSTRDTYRPVAQKRRYYRDMPGDISGYGRYSVTPKRGYYPVAPKRGYYPVAPKKGYYPVPPKGDYYPVPPKGDYYPVPPKGDYYPVPPKGDYYPVPPKDEYYPVPPEDEYYPVPPTEEKVPPPPEEPRPERRPPPTKTPKITKEDKRRRKVRGEREEYEWHIGNPLITLDEFFASPPQPKKPVKSKNMIPMVPAGVV